MRLVLIYDDSSGLRHNWLFDNNMADRVGNANLLSASSTRFPADFLHDADGDMRYIDIDLNMDDLQAPEGVYFGDDELTVSTWVRLTTCRQPVTMLQFAVEPTSTSGIYEDSVQIDLSLYGLCIPYFKVALSVSSSSSSGASSTAPFAFDYDVLSAWRRNMQPSRWAHYAFTLRTNGYSTGDFLPNARLHLRDLKIFSRSLSDWEVVNEWRLLRTWAAGMKRCYCDLGVCSSTVGSDDLACPSEGNDCLGDLDCLPRSSGMHFSLFET